MTARLTLLIIHAVLLVLASTHFTVVTFFWDGKWQWTYYQYTRLSGWGLPYHSPYPLPVVLAYIAAYAAGIATYAMISLKNSPLIATIGMLACVLCLASFIVELTHWFSQWYGSWIVSLPAPLLALALLGFWLQCAPVRSPSPAAAA